MYQICASYQSCFPILGLFRLMGSVAPIRSEIRTVQFLLFFEGIIGMDANIIPVFEGNWCLRSELAWFKSRSYKLNLEPRKFIPALNEADISHLGMSIQIASLAISSGTLSSGHAQVQQNFESRIHPPSAYGHPISRHRRHLCSGSGASSINLQISISTLRTFKRNGCF